MNQPLKKLQTELTSEFITSANFFSKFYVDSIKIQNKAFCLGFKEALKMVQKFSLQNAVSSSTSKDLGVISVDKVISFLSFLSNQEDKKLSNENSKNINSNTYQNNQNNDNNININRSDKKTFNGRNQYSNNDSQFNFDIPFDDGMGKTDEEDEEDEFLGYENLNKGWVPPPISVGEKRNFRSLNFDGFYNPNIPVKKRKFDNDNDVEY